MQVTLAGATLEARTSGALVWPDEALLVVGDLHLGRAERLARQGAGLLPPYETADTLDRLEDEIRSVEPAVVICLGDSFDDLAAARNLSRDTVARIARLAAGRQWIWVTGNHDPGPVDMPGTCLTEVRRGAILFRHIAEPVPPATGTGEVSAHYHPKARLTRAGRRITRPCFLTDPHRILLPAFGTYTGGLDVRQEAFRPLFDGAARALLLGRRITPVPVDRLG